MGTGDIWEISVPTTQFCCKPKTALKKTLKICLTQLPNMGIEKWHLHWFKGMEIKEYKCNTHIHITYARQLTLLRSVSFICKMEIIPANLYGH